MMTVATARRGEAACLILLALTVGGCAYLATPERPLRQREETSAGDDALEDVPAETLQHEMKEALAQVPVFSLDDSLKATQEYAVRYALESLLDGPPDDALRDALAAALDAALAEHHEKVPGKTFKDAMKGALETVPEDALKDALEDALGGALEKPAGDGDSVKDALAEALADADDSRLMKGLTGALEDTLDYARNYTEEFIGVYTPSIWPVEHPKRYISSRFGALRGTRGGPRRRHKGIDLVVPHGTPVLAAASGKVVFAGTSRGYGNVVKIDHWNGLATWYAHLDSFSIEQGDDVVCGQEIGKVGRTGYATTAHLHYEVHVDGKPVDPEPYLPL